ncbi:unnamed protein product [Acanthoscelides obtectus]|uniref:Uncharacterized protein n=1 Tax=Acanthoscelides obtectus TaxID=200917 RepID=A0A9P0QJ36_ACAOB|nr:unnamed protein product [Acanthoscelides obtectus]CAK1685356.1 hypothetical protein AOBTE_LOCUS35342 [Acanthoscelides obtectus]
MNCQTHPKIK